MPTKKDDFDPGQSSYMHQWFKTSFFVNYWYEGLVPNTGKIASLLI